MHKMLVAIPYVAAVVLYLANYFRDFVPLKPQPVEHWPWQFSQPVLLASFSPLIAISQQGIGGEQQAILGAVSAASVLVVIILMTVVGRVEYARSQLLIGTSSWALPWLTPAKLVLLVGILAIIACGTVTIWIAA